MNVCRSKLAELQEDVVATNTSYNIIFPTLLKNALEATGESDRKLILHEIGSENLNKFDEKVIFNLFHSIRMYLICWAFFGSQSQGCADWGRVGSVVLPIFSNLQES